MKTKIAVMNENFKEKQATLANASKVLKEEFTGIDQVIDEVIESVSSWYFMPELQEQPAIINLWGLTGVGKTSLVSRLAKLLQFEDYFYRIDLGVKHGRNSFSETIGDICENNNNEPMIIALDEIQHSRTISGPFRKEIENDKNRLIWELIDTGNIQYFEWRKGKSAIEEVVLRLSHLIKAGVKVKNGLVHKNAEFYCEEMLLPFVKDMEIPFVPESIYENIIEFAGDELGLHLRRDVEKLLFSLSAKESIKFLKKVLKIARKPLSRKYKNALIFVMGNIDEAYSMSDDFSTDIDPDELNEKSQKITVPEIKDALQIRFRSEQIARLGNIHIIFPAFRKIDYQVIIENELKKYAKSLTDTFKFKVSFDRSVNDVIYDEGVYPSQGVRPVFTTIHQIVKSKINCFYSEIILKSLSVDHLHISVKGKKLNCTYYKNKQELTCVEIDIRTKLDQERQNRQDDMQAISAVHESGHAVISIILMRTIPQVIYSVTTDNNKQGYVQCKMAWKYISRKEIIPRVANMLAGYVAEEMIYGKENLTTGSSSDIDKATRFLIDMYGKNGMGKKPLKYGMNIFERSEISLQFSEAEEQILEALDEAKELAERTLRKERKLLLAIADFLSDQRLLRKDEIIKITEANISEKIDFIENGDHLYYRAKLKSLVEHAVNAKTPGNYESLISLNIKQHK